MAESASNNELKVLADQEEHKNTQNRDSEKRKITFSGISKINLATIKQIMD